MEALLPLLFLVPCVLMMVMMMRGHGHGRQEKPAATASTAELRRRREALDRLIDERDGAGEEHGAAGRGRALRHDDLGAP